MTLAYQCTIQINQSERCVFTGATSPRVLKRSTVPTHQSFRIYPPTTLPLTYEVPFEIFCIIMTLEEVLIQKFAERAQCTGKALEEVLLSAKENDCLTVGVYESAKVMNV